MIDLSLSSSYVQRIFHCFLAKIPWKKKLHLKTKWPKQETPEFVVFPVSDDFAHLFSYACV